MLKPLIKNNLYAIWLGFSLGSIGDKLGSLNSTENLITMAIIVVPTVLLVTIRD